MAGVALAVCGGCGGPRAAAGRPVTVWGREGWGDGEFLQPRAIGARDGEVYVIDKTGRVQVFTFDGAFKRMWKTPDAANGTPTAVSFARDGRVLIADTHYSQILEYTPGGELLREWGRYGPGPNEFIYPTDIAEGPDGGYFISEYGEDAERVHVFDADRRFVRQWGTHGTGPGEFSRAMAIEIDAAGRIFVADTANHRIQMFSIEGELLGIIGEAGLGEGQLKFPFDIALAPGGVLLACEYGAHRVSLYDVQGRFITCFGGPGRAPGQFNGPRGVAASPSGDVFVADTDNHRIQRFDLGGLA